MSQQPEQQPEFLTRKEWDDWQAKQQANEHVPEPDEDYVPAWAKQLTDKVDGLTNSSKTKTPPTPEQSPNNTPATKVEPPPPVVEPKKDFWPKNWPRIL